MVDDKLAVRAKDVHVTRGLTHILRGISCEITAGGCTAILGANGSGKTTFTRTLTGQMFITQGDIDVLGQRVGQTDMRALRQQISVVNPTTDAAGAHMSGAVVDASLTTTEAILTGFFGTIGLYEKVTDQHSARADEVIKQFHLEDRKDLRYSLLSTGEQRRCLLARALVHMPSLLILDEPTAGLDIRGREMVLNMIENILDMPDNDRPTVLMITHHVEELSPRTNQVILLKDGQVLQDGTPGEVITSENLTETFGCKLEVTKNHDRWWLQVRATC